MICTLAILARILISGTFEVRVLCIAGLLTYLICGHPVGPHHEGSSLYGTAKELLGNALLKQALAIVRQTVCSFQLCNLSSKS